MGCSTAIAALGAGLLACTLAAPALCADFRDATWGMTRDQVRQTEPRPPLQESGDALFYRGRVAGMDAIIVYQFAGDVLFRCAYLIGAGYSGYEPALADYQTVKGDLMRKYGAPVDERMSWAHEAAQSGYPPRAYDQAIARGYLQLNTRWEYGGGIVGLRLAKGAANARRMTVAYEDPGTGGAEHVRHGGAAQDHF